MKDIPIFTCEYGMATLILREIPYRGEGYVLLRAVFSELLPLLRACVGFCRAAGAERVYFSGNDALSSYPRYACLRERSIAADALPPTDAEAVPLKPEEAERWAEQYRRRFCDVPAAQSCTSAFLKEVLSEREGYYVVRGGRTVGLGQLRGGELAALASLERGAGRDVVCALAKRLSTPQIRLVCAEENLPAMRLYDALGFELGAVRECWYAADV